MAIERGFCGHFFDHQENSACPYCRWEGERIREVINPIEELKGLREIPDEFAVVYSQHDAVGDCVWIVADRKKALGWWYYKGGRHFDDKLALLGCFETSDSDFFNVFEMLMRCDALSLPWTERKDEHLVGCGSNKYGFVINGVYWSLPCGDVDSDKARQKNIMKVVDNFFESGRINSYSYFRNSCFGDDDPPRTPQLVIGIDDVETCGFGHFYDKGSACKCPFCFSGKESLGLKGYSCAVIEKVVGWLVSTAEHEKGRDYPLTSGYNDIGLNGVNLAGDIAYAKVFFDYKESSFYVVSGGVGGGVYLNGESVLTPSLLHPYDEIKVSEATYVFYPLCGDRFNW